MNSTKTWYQSKSVWGSIITLASMAAAVAGSPVAASEQQALIELTTAGAAALGAIISLVGRLMARHQIS